MSESELSSRLLPRNLVRTVTGHRSIFRVEPALLNICAASASASTRSASHACECLKEVGEIHVLLTHSLFGGGIPRRLLLRVSPVKSTSAPLRYGWRRGTKPRFGARPHPEPQETHHEAGAIRHTNGDLQILRSLSPPDLEDEKFDRKEAVGIDLMLKGLAHMKTSSDEILAAGISAVEALFYALRAGKTIAARVAGALVSPAKRMRYDIM
jgi:hypothetical protein